MMHLAGLDELNGIDEKRSRGYHKRKNDKRAAEKAKELGDNPWEGTFNRRQTKRRGQKKVNYAAPNHKRVSDEEHEGEIVPSSEMIKQGTMKTHPKFSDAIHKFASDKQSFTDAISKAKEDRAGSIKRTHNGFYNPTKRDMQFPGHESGKWKRAKRNNKKGNPVDKPIVLRHKDEQGRTHHHGISGNHRIAAGGKKTRVNFIDV